MPEKEIVLGLMSLKTLLHIETTPSQGVRKLLDNNVLGSPGKSMVYRQLKTREKYVHLLQPFFVSLVRNTRVLATCCFCKRDFSAFGRQKEGYYVRYFSFHDSFRKSGYRFLDKPEKAGVLRSEIAGLLSGERFGAESNNFFYAYLDGDNIRSKKLTESFGFKKIAHFSSLVFSRLYPKQHLQVKKLTHEEWLDFYPALLKFYADHNLFTAENLFYEGNYYVFVQDGEIVAGMQANPEHWRVHDMPGLSGKILMKLFPAFSSLSKIFHPDFRFLSIEGIYYQEGQSHFLQDMLSHLLATHGLYSAILCLDPTSKEYEAVHALDMGLVSKIRKPKLMEVIVKQNGNSEASITGPVYISTFDVT